ncbi:uncharacterized protein METZ01_LOCUS384943, partial [marine metagenome]
MRYRPRCIVIEIDPFALRHVDYHLE